MFGAKRNKATSIQTRSWLTDSVADRWMMHASYLFIVSLIYGRSTRMWLIGVASFFVANIFV